MTGPGHTPAPAQKTVYYAEDRCAARWPFMVSGLWAPALEVVFFAISLTQHGAAYWLFFALFAACVGISALFKGEWLYYYWPAGIRLDQDGVKIGGVRWAERHPGEPPSAKATVPKQAFFVFSCPWQGVVWIWVETGKQRIRTVKRHAYRGRKPTPLGTWPPPSPTPSWSSASTSTKPPCPTSAPPAACCRPTTPPPATSRDRWIVPTRHPRRLKAALAALPLPDGIVLLVRQQPFASWPGRSRCRGASGRWLCRTFGGSWLC